MPGTHITDQQARLYMDLRRYHSRQIAAAKSGISSSTGARLDADPRPPSQKRQPRTRRRPDPLAPVWDSEILPMLQAMTKPTEGAEQAIRANTALGGQRASASDLEFAIRQLVEVAVRALSPGINDPHTAMSVLDRLGASLCDAAPLHLATG